MTRLVVFRAPAVKKIQTATTPVDHTPATSSTREDSEMNQHYAQNLMKAACAGMSDYAPAADWQAALDDHVRKHAQPGEKFEAAYLRVTTNTPDGIALAKCEREAARAEMVSIAKTRTTGRVPDRTPRDVVRDASEQELAKRATDRAQAENTSFERAYCREAETPEGRELLAAAMQ